MRGFVVRKLKDYLIQPNSSYTEEPHNWAPPSDDTNLAFDVFCARENVNRRKGKDRSRSQCMSRHSANVAERNKKQYENGRDHN